MYAPCLVTYVKSLMYLEFKCALFSVQSGCRSDLKPLFRRGTHHSNPNRDTIFISGQRKTCIATSAQLPRPRTGTSTSRSVTWLTPSKIRNGTSLRYLYGSMRERQRSTRHGIARKTARCTASGSIRAGTRASKLSCPNLHSVRSKSEPLRACAHPKLALDRAIENSLCFRVRSSIYPCGRARKKVPLTGPGN